MLTQKVTSLYGMRRRGVTSGEGKMQPDTTKRSSSDFSTEEVRLLKLLRQGQTRDAIARELGINWSVVAARVSTIIRKAGARNRVELLALIDQLMIE